MSNLSDFGGGVDEPDENEESADWPPTAETLIDNTRSVTFHRKGLNSRVVVELASDDQEVNIDFTMREWTHKGSETLETQFTTAFFPAEIDVTTEDWQRLKDEWRDMAIINEGS